MRTTARLERRFEWVNAPVPYVQGAIGAIEANRPNRPAPTHALRR
jgi:hypothetical protein